MEDNNQQLIVNDDGLYIEKGQTPPRLRAPHGTIGEPEKQALAWEYYIKSWREGKPSAVAAGLKAGYSKSTSNQLNNFKWFKDKKDKLRRSVMMTKAERNINRGLDVDYSKMKVLPDGTEIEEIDVDLFRAVNDLSKTIVTTLGKDVGYSTKTEVGGGMQSEIKINSISYADPIQVANKIVDEGVLQLEKAEEEVLKEIIEKQK